MLADGNGTHEMVLMKCNVQFLPPDLDFANRLCSQDGTKHGIPIGNTPGVLTETTAEIAAALTLAAARRVCEADVFMRRGNTRAGFPLFLWASSCSTKLSA